jgi:hypothetical protein
VTEITDQLEIPFDPSKEEGTPEFSPIPKGKYVACITDAKVVTYKTGKGQGVTLTWEIEGDEKYAGRLVFDRVTISHENADATRIGRQKFKDICDATGTTTAVTDLSVLRNKSCWIQVGIEEDETGEYAPKNKVVRVRALAKPSNSNGEKPPFNDGLPEFMR